MPEFERKLDPLKDFAYERFKVLEISEGEKTTLVGVIVYNEGKNLVVIGEVNGLEGNFLRVVYSSQDPVFDKENYPGSEDRIRDLSAYNEIHVFQVPLKNFKAKAIESIQGMPKVSIGVPLVNPGTKTEEKLYLDEEELLSAFATEKGGLLHFEGSNLPEELALVLERIYKDKKVGIVLFFHPEDGELSFDSQKGPMSFLANIEEELKKVSFSDLQEDALRKIEEAINLGELNFKSSVKKQIFKILALSLARLWERTEDGDFLSDLDYILPKTKHVLFFPVSNVVENSKRADEAVDNLFIGSGQAKEDNIVQISHEDSDKNSGSELYTDWAITLREQIGEDFGYDNRLMRVMLEEIADKIFSANTEYELVEDSIDALDDVKKLLDELMFTEFESAVIFYSLDWSKKKKIGFDSDSSISMRTGRDLITELAERHLRERMKAQEEDEF